MFDRNAYQREWVKNHPEYQRRKKSLLKDWREQHPDYQKLWRRKNPDKFSVYYRRNVEKKKRAVLEHYSKENPPSCAHCGIEDTDVLCIDHINNDGYTTRKETGLGTAFYSWLIKHNFPEGFQVLCWNCNHKKEIIRRRNGYNV